MHARLKKYLYNELAYMPDGSNIYMMSWHRCQTKAIYELAKVPDKKYWATHNMGIITKLGGSGCTVATGNTHETIQSKRQHTLMQLTYV